MATSYSTLRTETTDYGLQSRCLFVCLFAHQADMQITFFCLLLGISFGSQADDSRLRRNRLDCFQGAVSSNADPKYDMDGEVGAMDSRGCQLPRAKSANLVIWSLAEAAIGGCGEEDGMGNPCRALDSSGIGIRRARRQAHLLQAACPKAHVFSFYFPFSLRSTCEALLSISLTLRRTKKRNGKK